MSEIELDCQNQPQQALHTIVEMVNALRTEKPLLGVGIAVPCPVVEAFVRTNSAKVERHTHSDALEGMLGVSVFVGNDANLGALAERWWGSCKGVDDFVFVKISTGVGAGLFQNGNIMLDIGYAGELGHVPISNEGLCRCGMMGCRSTHWIAPFERTDPVIRRWNTEHGCEVAERRSIQYCIECTR